MDVLPRLRRATRRISFVLALAPFVLFATAVGPVDAQSEADLDAVQDRMEEAEAEVERLGGELEISLEQLEAILAEQRVRQEELADLDDELAAAEAELADRERVLAATTAQLESTAERLEMARAQLGAARGEYEARVRQSYVNARPTQSLPVLSAGDASDFAQATTYMEAIVSRDRVIYEEIDVLQVQIAAAEEELEGLRARQGDQRTAAQQERDRVARLVAEQQELVAEVTAQAEDKQRVLAGLEADRQSAEALVADLEAESAQIEQELAAAAEEARRAAVEEAAPDVAGGGELSEEGGAPPVPSGSEGAPAADPDTGSAGGGFIIPVGGRISSEFGYRTHPISGTTRLHAGIDIAAAGGTPIGAAGAGTVIFAGWRGGYGNAVIIDHGQGVATLYAHQSRLGTTVGQQVAQGQTIGYVGTTGYSTGNHLHWEVRVNGSPANPRGHM